MTLLRLKILIPLIACLLLASVSVGLTSFALQPVTAEAVAVMTAEPTATGVTTPAGVIVAAPAGVQAME